MSSKKIPLSKLKKMIKNTKSLSAARLYYQEYYRRGGKLAIYEIRDFKGGNKKK